MNISIIGSSHSRDIFDIRYNKDYDKQYNVVSYIPMQSFLSIMSGPVLYNYRRMLMLDMNDEEWEYWYINLEKNVLKLQESVQPDILFIDFYADARYGAISYEGEYVTNKVKDIANKGIIIDKYLGITYGYDENTDDFIIMWKNFFDRFMAYMREKLPHTQIIVNAMKATELVKNDNKKTMAYKAAELEDMNIDTINSIWRIMDKYAIKKYKLRSVMNDIEYAMSTSYNKNADDINLMCFQKEYYRHCYKNFIDAIENKASTEKKESHENLISDSAFKYQLNYWSNIKGKYKFIEYKKYRGISIIDSRKELGNYTPQLWSRPIEIEGDGNVEYTLSFYIKIPDMSMLNEKSILFRIRTFNNIREVTAEEAVERHRLTMEGHDIKEGEEYRYTYTFKPTGRYLKVAPFLTECIPDVEYNRIKLERSSQASEYSK